MDFTPFFYSHVAHPRETPRPSIIDKSFPKPSSLPSTLGKAEKHLFSLIYARTIQSVMTPKISNATAVTVDVNKGKMEVRCTGSVTIQEGWSAAISPELGADAADASVSEPALPLPSALAVGSKLTCLKISSKQRSTQPPSRFNDASFVKELEAKGVGRPSTYASVLETLRKRAYITSAQEDGGVRAGSGLAKGGMISAQRAAGVTIGKGRGAIVPSLTAFVVCDLLASNVPDYISSEFTSDMERRLDFIAKGKGDKGGYLREYYEGEDGLKRKVEVMDSTVSSDDARRACLPSLTNSSVSLFVGPWGPYAVREETPGKRQTAPVPGGMISNLEDVTPEVLNRILDGRQGNGTVLGEHEGKKVSLMLGRFGAYLQHGQTGEEGTRTQTLPKELGGMGGKGLVNIVGSGEGLAEMLGINFEDAMKVRAFAGRVLEADDRVCPRPFAL